MQLIFYAGMQVPAGVLLDRFGTKRLLAAGALLMTAAQLIVAYAPNLELAVIGRAMVGVGDACTFISMIRLVNLWYSGQRASKLQQWLATFGQLGQLLSAIPFVALLHLTDWSSAFTWLAVFSLLSAVLVLAKVADPTSEHSTVRIGVVLARLRSNLRLPVTWLAFFTHFLAQPSGTVFVLLWGVPLMMRSWNFDRPTASLALSFVVIVNAGCGPFIGALSAKYPQFRGGFVLTVGLLISGSWIALVNSGGVPPQWLIISALTAFGLGGSTAMIAFDFTKDRITPRELGASNGFVNIGGFLAALLMMWLVGAVLDWQGGPNLYVQAHFKVALAAQLVVLGIGLCGFLISLKRYRNTPAK